MMERIPDHIQDEMNAQAEQNDLEVSIEDYLKMTPDERKQRWPQNKEKGQDSHLEAQHT